MSGVSRRIKQQARRLIHKEFCVEVYCFRANDFDDYQVKTARTHTRMRDVEAVGDDGDEYQLSAEIQPRLVFMTADYRPQHGDACIVNEKEGYLVKTIEDPDIDSVSVRCTAMDEDDISNYRFPRKC